MFTSFLLFVSCWHMVRLLVASTLAFKIFGTLGANTTVMVHLAHRTFTNQTVNVAAGDAVQFISLNPTGPFRVIQTMFNAPCRPLQNGFDSGSIFGTTPYNVTVTGLEPIWFYEHGECTEGMVGAINAPTEGNTFDAFQAAAQVSQESDEPLPSTSSSGSISSSPETSPTTTPLSTPLPLSMTSSSLDDSTASRGTGTSIPKSAPVSRPSRIAVIIAVTVGTAALCLVLVVIALLCRRRRHRVRGQGARIAPIPPPPSSSHRAGKSSVSSEAEPWRSETEDVRTELAQLRELVVTQLAPPPPQYHDIARVSSTSV